MVPYLDSSLKPVVVVSKCLGFAHCRYDGGIIENDFVDRLGRFVEYRPVCPEEEIGMGVPREPIQIEMVEGEKRLVQPASGRDLTIAMRSFCNSFLEDLGPVDGFLMKARSPSCGIRDAEIYEDSSICKGSGFFANAVMERFAGLAISSEAMLEDLQWRELFLAKLWAIASNSSRPYPQELLK